MSKQVDNRIAQLELDNSNFEKNAHQSLGTIDELDEALKFNDADEGFSRIEKHSSKFNLGGMSVAIESVVHKFSALEIAGITAIQNITNKAVDYGTNLAKSMSVDQVTAGWSKYEQKTSSVQTLLNSTGKSMEEIDGYLGRLMAYSDETSYSFTEMTSALAQMTSSGGDIDKLMPMIMGIANATAFAGKGAREFQSTIRNLGQSYQAGHLQLMDMKSLNLMGTSSKQLKETFISVAESMGRIEKGAVTVESFDESLKSGWADREVMEAALGRFSEYSQAVLDAVERGEYDTAGDAMKEMGEGFDELSRKAFESAQTAKTFGEAIEATKDAVSSGWMETFETIFGNYEEAKEMWTHLADVLWDLFASGAEARNKALKEWKAGGGRDALLEAITNFYHGVQAIVSPIKEAFDGIFGSINSEFLLNLTDKIKSISEKFKNAFGYIEEAAEDGKDAIDDVKDTVETVLGPVAKTKEVLDELANSVIMGKYGNGQTRIDQLRELGYSFELVQNRVNELLGCSFRYEVAEDDIIDTEEKRADGLNDLKESTEEITEETEAYREELKKQEKAVKKNNDRMKKVGKIFEGIFSAIKLVVDILKQAGEAAAKIFSTAWEKALLPVIDWFIDLGAKVSEYVTGLSNSLEFAQKIKDFFTKFADTVSGWITKISDFVKNLWKNIADRGSFEHLFESLRSLLDMFGEIAEAIFGGLVGGIEKLSDEGTIKMPTIDDLGGWVDMVVTAIADFIDNVVSHKDEITGFFSIFTQDVVTRVGGIADSLTNLFSTSMTFFNNPFEKLTQFFTDGEKELFKLDGPMGEVNAGVERMAGGAETLVDTLSMDDLFAKAKNVGLIAVIFEALRGISNLASAFGNASKIPKTLMGVFTDLRNTMVAYQNNLNAKNLKTVAEAIGIMVLAIIGLSLIDDQEKIEKATATIMFMAIALAVVLKAMTEYKKLSAMQVASKEILKPIVQFLQGVKDAIARGIKIAAFGALMIGIAIAVGLILKIIGDLAQVNWEEMGGNFLKAAGIVAGIIFFITMMAGLYGLMTKNKKTRTTAGDALVFVGMAVAMVIIVQAIKVLMDELDVMDESAIGKLIAAVTAIGVLMLAMGIAAGLATSGKGGKGKGLMSFGASMIMMAGAIAIILYAISTISDVPLGHVAVTGALIIGVIAVFGAIMYAMGKLNAQQSSMAISAITAMSISFAALAGSMVLVGTYADQVKAALGPMVLIFLILGGFLAIVAGLKLGESLLMMSYSFAAFGVSLLALAAAALVFGIAIPYVIDGLAYLGEAVQTKGDAIAVGIGVVLAAIALAIIANKYIIGKSIGELVASVMEHLSWSFLKTLPKILLVLGLGLLLILGFLRAFAPDFVDSLVELLLSVMHSIAKAFREYAPEIYAAIMDILDAIWDMILEFLAITIDQLVGKNKFSNWLRGLKEDTEGVSQAVTAVTEANAKYNESIANTGENWEKRYSKSTDNLKTKMAEASQEAENLKETFQGTGEQVASSGGLITDSVEDLKNQVLEKTDMGDELTTTIDNVMGNTGLQITNDSPLVTDPAQTLANDTEQPFIDLKDKAYDNGTNIDYGLGNGIRDNGDYAVTEASNVATRINAEFEKIERIGSPSKVWHEYGRYLMLGLGNGIRKMSSNVIGETEDLAYAINNPMTGIASKISSILDSNLELAPTIRPVLDTSGIESGSSLINGLFNARHVGVYAGEIQTNSMRLAGEIDSALDSRLGEFNAAMQMFGEAESNRTIEVPLTIDGREFARATATYQRDEINRLDRNDLRRLGTV